MTSNFNHQSKLILNISFPKLVSNILQICLISLYVYIYIYIYVILDIIHQNGSIPKKISPSHPQLVQDPLLPGPLGHPEAPGLRSLRHLGHGLLLPIAPRVGGMVVSIGTIGFTMVYHKIKSRYQESSSIFVDAYIKNNIDPYYWSILFIDRLIDRSIATFQTGTCRCSALLCSLLLLRMLRGHRRFLRLENWAVAHLAQQGLPPNHPLYGWIAMT